MSNEKLLRTHREWFLKCWWRGGLQIGHADLIWSYGKTINQIQILIVGMFTEVNYGTYQVHEGLGRPTRNNSSPVAVGRWM